MKTDTYFWSLTIGPWATDAAGIKAKSFQLIRRLSANAITNSGGSVDRISTVAVTASKPKAVIRFTIAVTGSGIKMVPV